MFPVGTEVGVKVDPFDIQIMKKPESEDEEAVPIEEYRVFHDVRVQVPSLAP